MKSLILMLAGAVLLAGCATQIHPQDETIKPPNTKFSSFKAVTLKPLVVDKSGGDSGDAAAVVKIENELRNCLTQALPALQQPAAPADARLLQIEPSIVDLKKVNTAERIFTGAMSGSSAVLLKLKYIEPATQQVVAEPVFYAKANAIGAAWTFGSTDNLMLTRVVNNACDYTRKHY